MSNFETDQDREARYTWDKDSGVEVVHRGDGEDLDLSILDGGRANDSDGHVHDTGDIHGIRYVIETPKGYERHGKSWRTIMPADYGYILGEPGADGDSLDCYVGPDHNSEWVYVVDQRYLPEINGGFDESKVLLGFSSQGEALRAYKAGHHRWRDVFMSFSPMTMAEFKLWLAMRNPDKPCSEAVMPV